MVLISFKWQATEPTTYGTSFRSRLWNYINSERQCQALQDLPKLRHSPFRLRAEISAVESLVFGGRKMFLNRISVIHVVNTATPFSSETFFWCIQKYFWSVRWMKLKNIGEVLLYNVHRRPKQNKIWSGFRLCFKKAENFFHCTGI